MRPIGFRTPELPPDTKGLSPRTVGHLQGLLWVSGILIFESKAEERILQGIKDFKSDIDRKSGQTNTEYQKGLHDILNHLEQMIRRNLSERASSDPRRQDRH